MPLISTSEVAEVLGVTPVTVRRWVRKGRIAPRWITPGGQYRFSVDHILALENTQRDRSVDLKQDAASWLAEKLAKRRVLSV